MKAEYRNSIRSQAQIKKCFIELLMEKPAQKITVTDIIKRADISRGTFYLHFQDTVDLMDSFERDFVNQMITIIQKNKDDSLVDKLDNLFNQILEILQSDLDTYRALSNQDIRIPFFIEVKNNIINELLDNCCASKDIHHRLNIYISGFTMILREWIDDPQFSHIENCVAVLLKMIHQDQFLQAVRKE